MEPNLRYQDAPDRLALLRMFVWHFVLYDCLVVCPLLLLSSSMFTSRRLVEMDEKHQILDELEFPDREMQIPKRSPIDRLGGACVLVY